MRYLGRKLIMRLADCQVPIKDAPWGQKNTACHHTVFFKIDFE